MRVIVCYSNELHPKTASAIAKHAPEAELVPTFGLYDYPEAIASRWDGLDDLVVIEADKEITADVIPSFAACDQDWCSYSYAIFPMPFTRDTTVGLGCTRYSARIQREVKVSEFMRPDYDWTPCPDCNGKGCWRYLDTRISMAIMSRQIIVHCHGFIKHHHKYGRDWYEMRGMKVPEEL